MSTVHLHASLQRFADNYEQVNIPSNCPLPEFLQRLVADYPRLKPIIFSGDSISPYLVIYINGEDARHLPADVTIAPDAQVEIITSLVGG